MNKIKEKLTGSSSDQNKLQKHSNETSSGGSSLQHPIASSKNSGPTGTAVSNDGYGSQPSGYSSQPSGYSSQPSGYSSQPSGYSSQPSGYSSQPSGYSSGATDRMPGSYTNEDEYSSQNTTSGSSQRFDPYSRKGQMTAAGGTHPSNQTQDYGRSSYEDPSVARSTQGGVVNQTGDQRYSSGSHNTGSNFPTSGQPLSSGGQYESQPSSTQHHYGRDGAMAGGAGTAGGVGAYEMRKDQQQSRTMPQSHSDDYQHMTTGNQQPQDTYMNRSAADGQYEPQSGHSMGDSTMGGAPTSGGPEGLEQAKKVSGAYESGYRDAMEHMNAEMHE